MDTILYFVVVGSIALVFPIIAAVVAFRKGHPVWGIVTIVSIFLAIGWLVGILAIIQPDERKERAASSSQDSGSASAALPAIEIGSPFLRTRWEIRISPEWLDLCCLDQQTNIHISKEEGKFAIGFASLFPWGFNLKVQTGGREYRFRLASSDLARIRAWRIPLTKSEKAFARKQSINQGSGLPPKPPTFESTAKSPLTFSESTYWWLWIPVLSWIPFAIPLVIPLGPIWVGFSIANKIGFIREAAAHNGDDLPSGGEAFVESLITLGYTWVYRTYRATKKMMAEQGTDTIEGWTPWLLPFYILCPALVYMPLIRAMSEHWQRHVAGRYI
jgi:hypothetical protein